MESGLTEGEGGLYLLPAKTKVIPFQFVPQPEDVGKELQVGPQSTCTRKRNTGLGFWFEYWHLSKADLHGSILSHATSLRHEKSRRILKHVLKPCNNCGLISVVSVS